MQNKENPQFLSEAEWVMKGKWGDTSLLGNLKQAGNEMFVLKISQRL